MTYFCYLCAQLTRDLLAIAKFRVRKSQDVAGLLSLANYVFLHGLRLLCLSLPAPVTTGYCFEACHAVALWVCPSTKMYVTRSQTR